MNLRQKGTNALSKILKIEKNIEVVERQVYKKYN